MILNMLLWVLIVTLSFQNETLPFEETDTDKVTISNEVKHIIGYNNSYF